MKKDFQKKTQVEHQNSKWYILKESRKGLFLFGGGIVGLIIAYIGSEFLGLLSFSLYGVSILFIIIGPIIFVFMFVSGIIKGIYGKIKKP